MILFFENIPTIPSLKLMLFCLPPVCVEGKAAPATVCDSSITRFSRQPSR